MSRAHWIYDPDYKHYRNFAQSCTVFVTTTILDFTPALADTAAADLMTASLFDDCAHYGATLWAFVVMATHVHFLADLPSGVDSSDFVERVKSNSGRRLLRVVTPVVQRALSVQQGLGRRTFWQRGFRSVPIVDRDAFATKVRYIDNNPVDAGLCNEPTGYRWSSAWLVEAGFASWERGVVLPEELLRQFASEEALSLARKSRRKE